MTTSPGSCRARSFPTLTRVGVTFRAAESDEKSENRMQLVRRLDLRRGNCSRAFDSSRSLAE